MSSLIVVRLLLLECYCIEAIIAIATKDTNAIHVA